jgi:hypothetical protein
MEKRSQAGVWTKFDRRLPPVQNFAYINWGMACGQILSKLQSQGQKKITERPDNQDRQDKSLCYILSILIILAILLFF